MNPRRPAVIVGPAAVLHKNLLRASRCSPSGPNDPLPATGFPGLWLRAVVGPLLYIHYKYYHYKEKDNRGNAELCKERVLVTLRFGAFPFVGFTFYPLRVRFGAADLGPFHLLHRLLRDAVRRGLASGARRQEGARAGLQIFDRGGQRGRDRD